MHRARLHRVHLRKSTWRAIASHSSFRDQRKLLSLDGLDERAQKWSQPCCTVLVMATAYCCIYVSSPCMLCCCNSLLTQCIQHCLAELLSFAQGAGSLKAGLLADNKGKLRQAKQHARELSLTINGTKRQIDALKAFEEAASMEQVASPLLSALIRSCARA